VRLYKKYVRDKIFLFCMHIIFVSVSFRLAVFIVGCRRSSFLRPGNSLLIVFLPRLYSYDAVAFSFPATAPSKTHTWFVGSQTLVPAHNITPGHLRLRTILLTDFSPPICADVGHLSLLSFCQCKQPTT